MAASEQVRAFYERMPYPPPTTTLEAQRDLYRNPVRRRALHHRLWPTTPQRRNQRILIAGCGTSQAARYALREHDARVTAIDVSATSLQHTQALKRTYGLDNLEMHRLAIEDARELGRRFDLIVCTGVLHHLPDPDAGLRALHDVLQPNGALHVMVYAAYGRAGIYMIQEYCRLLGVGTSPQELQDLGALLESLPANHAIADVLRHAKDFRQPDAMADALLHPLDRAFTVPQLYAWLERCGMTFGRWIEQAPYVAQCARSPGARTPRASLPCRRRSNTQPSSSFVAPWCRTARSLTGTTAPAPRSSRSRSTMIAGVAMSRFRFRGLPRSATGSRAAASRCCSIARIHSRISSFLLRPSKSRCWTPSTAHERSPRFSGPRRAAMPERGWRSTSFSDSGGMTRSCSTRRAAHKAAHAQVSAGC